MRHDHVVTFYDCDADLVAELAEFVAEGLDGDECVLVVATAEHRSALDEVLVQYGVDADRERADGRLRCRDAAEVLATFMTADGPDAALFAAVLGPMLDDAGPAVRIYGEMVALLWADGDVAGALQLEALWNGLASTHRFFLRCGYPSSVLDSSLHHTHALCDVHSQVTAPRSYWDIAAAWSSDTTVASRDSEVYLPVAAAIPAARRFVAATLRSWGQQELVADGALVVSELATNAVRHAESPFRISLHRLTSAVRIAIEDVGIAGPAARVASPDEAGGRGVQIVEEVASTWGWERGTSGKTVWAELETRPAAGA